jgi:hypothetical protein
MKIYHCLVKCYFQNRLHEEGAYYSYPDTTQMPVSKLHGPMFVEVTAASAGLEVRAGGLGPQVVNPTPDIRQPKIIDTTVEPEGIRPRGRVKKTGLASGGIPGQLNKE